MDAGQPGGLVIDERERCVLRRVEMVCEGAARERTGHGSFTFWRPVAPDGSGNQGERLSPVPGDLR